MTRHLKDVSKKTIYGNPQKRLYSLYYRRRRVYDCQRRGLSTLEGARMCRCRRIYCEWCVCVLTYINTCMHTYIHSHSHTHTHTHTHTHVTHTNTHEKHIHIFTYTDGGSLRNTRRLRGLDLIRMGGTLLTFMHSTTCGCVS